MCFSSTCVAIHKEKSILTCSFIDFLWEKFVYDIFASFLKYISWSLTVTKNMIKFIESVFYRSFYLYLLLVEIFDWLLERRDTDFRFEFDKYLSSDASTFSF